MGKSKHPLRVHRPPVGSHLFLVCTTANEQDYWKIVCRDGGRDRMVIDEYSFEHLRSSASNNIFDHKNVNHSYISGDLYVLPKTDKNVTFDNISYGDVRYFRVSLPGQVLYQGREVEHSTHNAGYVYDYTCTGVTSHYTNKMVDGRGVLTDDTEATFVIDWDSPNLDVQAFVIQHWVYKTIYGQKDEATNQSIRSARSFYLGKVINNDYDISWIEEKFLTPPMTPGSFLTDLYDKLSVPQVNNCENISQLKNWRELLPPFKSLIAKHNIKSFAELYLWWKYSYKTTLGDIKAYFNWLKSLYEQSRTGKAMCHYTLCYNLSDSDVLRYHIYTTPYSFGIFEALGLEINLSNTWDMIPFSFIVDWFVSVGDTLHSIDLQDLESRLKITALITSRKTQRLELPYATLSVQGKLLYSWYTRDISNQLPTNVVDIHFNDPSSHLLDATSLLLANKRK